MHIAQFVHRYPPALGGAEAYTARLCEHLAVRGDDVSVWTTTAIELEEMWFPANGRRKPAGFALSPLGRGSPSLRGGVRGEASRACSLHPSPGSQSLATLSRKGRGEDTPPVAHAPGSPGIYRFPPLHFPTRRYILKAFSLLPFRRWQCLTAPCNPVCPGMWRDTTRYDGPLDAVHATAFPYAFPIVCGLRLARRRGVPFFVTPFLHLGDPTNPRDRVRRQYTAPHLVWLLKQADGVFVQTRAERDAVLALGVSESRVHLQGLGVDPVECTDGDRERARAAWGIGPEEVVIGHLANNSIEKGTVDLLRAAEQAWARGQRFRVVLAGPEMPNFRAFWAGFGAKERVRRVGVLSEDQKRDFFAGIDAFSLPSRTDSFGLVLLEAWANGKPNLVYRAGGPAELVRDEIDGLQVRCGGVEALADQLTRLATDANLRQALGANGQARIEREFRWNDKLELVRNVLANGRREPADVTKPNQPAHADRSPVTAPSR